YLRRVADCEAIKTAFVTAKRIAIIGSGWIGLETAAAARAAGVEAPVIGTAAGARTRPRGRRDLPPPARPPRGHDAHERRSSRDHWRGPSGHRRTSRG